MLQKIQIHSHILSDPGMLGSQHIYIKLDVDVRLYFMANNL